MTADVPRALKLEEYLKIPGCLIDSIGTEDRTEVFRWWHSLAREDQDRLVAAFEEVPSFGPFPFPLEDEHMPDDYDDGGDRYEYLVNHEHRPAGTTIMCKTAPLPGIALLSPYWPPYPSRLRFQQWVETETLRNQYLAEVERYKRGHP